MAPSIILWEGWQWPANITRGKMVWQTSWPADPWHHFRRPNPRAGHVQGVGPFQRQKGLREGVEIRSAGQQCRSQCLCPGGDGKRCPVRAGTLPCQRDGAQRLGARILSCGMRLRPFTSSWYLPFCWCWFSTMFPWWAWLWRFRITKPTWAGLAVNLWDWLILWSSCRIPLSGRC